MTDMLRMDYINSLPQPFKVKLCGDKLLWPVIDIDVESGAFRIDVCGLSQVKHIGEVMFFLDACGVEHSPDDFFVEDEV